LKLLHCYLACRTCMMVAIGYCYRVSVILGVSVHGSVGSDAGIVACDDDGGAVVVVPVSGLGTSRTDQTFTSKTWK
jgi:hypothetical protein